MPERVTLHVSRPSGFEELGRAQWRQLVEDRVAHAEARAADQRRSEGRRVLGRKTVLRQSWRDRPQNHEPRRGLSPRVAARSKWSRIEALLRNKAFIAAYREARTRFLQGIKDALFPAGSYWMPRFAGASCIPVTGH